MESKHTPGPWRRTGAAVRTENGNLLIALFDPHGGLTEGQFATACADAQFCAAAPDLLAALQECLKAIAQARPLVVAHYNASTEGASTLQIMRLAAADAETAIAKALSPSA